MSGNLRHAYWQAYWNDRFRLHWDLAGAGSTLFGRQFNTWRYRARRRVFRRLVRELAPCPRSLSVLDAGCGTGFYLDEWRRLGVASLAGIDISDWAVARLARDYPSATFQQMDLGAPNSLLPPSAHDIVTAIDVLPHVPEDDVYLRALSHLHDTLKPGGYLIYTDAFFHGSDRRFEDYWRGRALSTALPALEACGFQLVARRPFSVLMSPPTDTRHPERNERLWNRIMRPVWGREWLGFLYGALLYPLELLLVAWLDESPAVEVLVCRKRSAS